MFCRYVNIDIDMRIIYRDVKDLVIYLLTIFLLLSTSHKYYSALYDKKNWMQIYVIFKESSYIRITHNYYLLKLIVLFKHPAYRNIYNIFRPILNSILRLDYMVKNT